MSTAVERELLTDQTAGLELVTGDEIALNAPRAIFLAADLLDPARLADIGMLDGGEELDNPCLRRTGGKLPRCTITPMEFWGVPMPLEQFPEGVRPLKIKGVEVEGDPARIGRRIGLDKPAYFMPMYPGDLIVDALGIAAGRRRGVVEIDVLRGVDYGPEYDAIQTLFFAPDFIKPIELRLIREHIERVGNSVADPDVKSAANNMIQSCDDSRAHMEAAVSLANTQLDTRRVYQWTYALTPKLRRFMEQLEIKPRGENAVAQLQDQVAAAVVGAGISPEQLEAIMANQTAAFASAMQSAISQAITAAKPTDAPTE